MMPQKMDTETISALLAPDMRWEYVWLPSGAMSEDQGIAAGWNAVTRDQVPSLAQGILPTIRFGKKGLYRRAKKQKHDIGVEQMGFDIQYGCSCGWVGERAYLTSVASMRVALEELEHHRAGLTRVSSPPSRMLGKRLEAE